MNNTEDIELIQRFRSGTLDEQEALDFHNKLSSDAAFKELYDDFFESEKLLKLKELWAVKEELDKYDYSDNASGKGGSGKWVLGVSLLALLGAGTWVYFTTNSTKNNLVVPSVSRSTNENEKESISKEVPEDVIHNESPAKVYRANTSQIDNRQESIKVDSIVAVVPMTVVKESITENSEPEKVAKVAKVEKTATIDCNEKPKIDYVTVGTCQEEKNGKVIFKSIQGQHSPYKIAADSVHWHKENAEFKGFSHGKHTFYVDDSRGCTTSFVVLVDKIACLKEEPSAKATSQSYLIYIPGQSWKIPMSGKNGKVEIRDQRGNVIFEKEVLKDENDEWGGLDMNSKEVNPGIYFFQIKEEGEKDKMGSITIMK